MLEVTFVGTGAAVTGPGRTNVVLLARGAGTGVLVDCGPTAFVQLDRLGIDPKHIPYLVVTHRHGDHVLGFPIYLLYRSHYIEQFPLTVLAGATTVRVLHHLVQEVYPELVQRLEHAKWVTLPETQTSTRDLGTGVRLTTAPVQGPDSTPTLGVRLDFSTGESVTYSSDTAPSDRVARLAAGSHLLIHESNFSRHLSPEVDATHYSHSTAHHAGEVAQQAGAHILALVHLSREYAGKEEQVADEARQVFGGTVIVPQDGAVIYLQGK